MRAKWLIALALAALVCGGGTAAAQGTQTGILRGTVQTQDKVSVPGATVTIKSPALQAERTTVTEADGTYIFRGLPPGTYTVSISKEGMAPIQQTADVPLGGVAEVNLSMSLTRSETVSVTADVSDVLTTPTVGANITKQTVDRLATPRTLPGIASLSPGVTMNTPNANQLSINGAFAYDNVFLMNGIDINDNLFGSPQRLYIEDAIQETQVLTSGISAEYGRFSGGVVNAITKSGGNTFSGSFRSNMGNPTWSTLTPFDVQSGVVHTSKLNNNYEGTFGGPIVRDRLWFFAATRLANIQNQNTFNKTGINYVNTNDNKRGEVKLTATPWSNQTFQFNYINNNTTLTRPPFGFSIDPHTIYTGQEPNWIAGGTWRGLMRNKYFRSRLLTADLRLPQRRRHEPGHHQLADHRAVTARPLQRAVLRRDRSGRSRQPAVLYEPLHQPGGRRPARPEGRLRVVSQSPHRRKFAVVNELRVRRRLCGGRRGSAADGSERFPDSDVHARRDANRTLDSGARRDDERRYELAVPPGSLGDGRACVNRPRGPL